MSYKVDDCPRMALHQVVDRWLTAAVPRWQVVAMLRHVADHVERETFDKRNFDPYCEIPDPRKRKTDVA